MIDRGYLNRAIKVGNEVAAPYNFGAVVVIGGEVVAAEHGHVHERNDPSLHAEVSAISAACRKSGSNHIEGATLYSSHEPCTMCLSCAAWAHIDRIVYAISAKDQESFMYEFRNPDIKKLATKLTRPVKVEHLPLR